MGVNYMADAFAMLKNIKETGKKVVGFYCVYAPQELVLAADALGFALCATKEEAIPDGEKTLPRNFCPLIKSSYGFAVTDKCPYFLYSDIIIGETTCDGKKKMFELMKEFKPVHVMKLPQTYLDDNDKAYWLNEVKILKDLLEKELGTTITEEKLREAIKVLNEERRLMQELSECMKNDPVPMTGQDFLKLMWGRNFVTDRTEFAQQIKEIIKDMQESIAKGEAAMPQGAKRILVTGVPTGIGSEKVIKIIEDCGAAVVYIENCSGMKQFVTLVDETKPPLEAIADKYLSTPCSCMSPNPIRLENLAKLIKDYRIDGVVDITWQGCHTYNVESRVVKEFLKKNGDTPFLQIETDYSQGDVEQIKTRVQAFLEMMA
jgi:benzoyl-CoA reductase/2-hydroxyglutaryl-CoA dehydratase subunit BcrC/BadD/HgdB